MPHLKDVVQNTHKEVIFLIRMLSGKKLLMFDFTCSLTGCQMLKYRSIVMKWLLVEVMTIDMIFGFTIFREQDSRAILEALRDERLNDPRERIEIAQSHAFYKPSLLGQP